MKTAEPASSLETGPESARVQLWSAPECPFSIEASPHVFGRIRQQAVAGMHTLPHGGLEVGGLLFGRVFPNARTPQKIEIVAERSLECAHRDGPAFILSDEERAQIANQLDQARRDSELSGLSVLGFWVSHSRGDLELSPHDLELYKLFPSSWQFVLILKPKLGARTRANVAFRASGHVRLPDPQHEFSADVSGLRLPQASTPEPGIASGEIRAPESRRGRRAGRAVSLWFALLLTVLAFLAGAALSSFLPTLFLPTLGMPTLGMPVPGNAAASEPDAGLRVEFFQAGPGVAVLWNVHARELQQASRAELVLVDATQTRTYPLNAKDIRKGFFYCDSLRNARMAAVRVLKRESGNQFPAEASNGQE